MNYELCKQLKDAGFPLSMKGYDDYCRQVYMDESNYEEEEERYAHKPTLSELIEACGDEFWLLKRMNPTYWLAEAKSIHVPVDGKTPEEAVARLWLALQE